MKKSSPLVTLLSFYTNVHIYINILTQVTSNAHLVQPQTAVNACLCSQWPALEKWEIFRKQTNKKYA